MNAKSTARQILDNMLNSGELSNTAWGIVSQNADDTMAEAARGLIEREPFEYMSETYCEIVLAHIAEYGNPTEATETPAPLDIPAAVRAYIEAEWRGSVGIMHVKRGEVIAAVLAADPELSNTAATFRFHNLVAEMRDNDSIEPVAVKVATDTTAESLAALAAIDAESTRRESAAAIAKGPDASVIYVSGDEVWYLGDAKRIPGGVLARGERCTVKVGNEDYEDDVQVTVGDVVVRVQPDDLAMIF